MQTQALRSKIDLRVSPSDKRVLERAASASSQSVSEFVRASAIDRANEALADRTTFVLSKAQFSKFQNL